MNYQLKHINNNLFLIDLDAEIKIGDYYFCVGKIQLNPPHYLQANNLFEINSGEFKIIAQLNTELPNIPLFTLPDKKVDVEKLADDFYTNRQPQVTNDQILKKVGFIQGYNQALSDNADKLYTKEDIELAVILARKTPEISLKDILNCCVRTQPNLSEYDGKFVKIEMEEWFAYGNGVKEKQLGVYQPKLSAEGKITIIKIL